MKIQLILIGAVVAMTLGVVTMASASAGSHNVAQLASTESSPSAEPSDSPEATPTPEPSETPEVEPSETPEVEASESPSTHPCNLGFFVSQAAQQAHGKHGMKETVVAAKALLEKDPTCTQTLPAPTTGAPTKGAEGPEQETADHEGSGGGGD